MPHTILRSASFSHRKMASAAPAENPVNAGLSATVDNDSKPTHRYADVSTHRHFRPRDPY